MADVVDFPTDLYSHAAKIAVRYAADLYERHMQTYGEDNVRRVMIPFNVMRAAGLEWADVNMVLMIRLEEAAAAQADPAA